MKSSRSSRVTQLLEIFEPGDHHAGEQLFADVYTELRALAARYLHRERKSHTLQPTALVHEAYLKLFGQTRVDWQGRAHFLAIAAHAMRQILVDHARRHRAAKRGGNRHRIALDDNLVVESSRDVDLLAIEDALTRLTKPSNIMIDGDGHVHIADFGIAAFVATAGADIPLAGTPAFMAPGLFHHQQPSKQSDLYALGMVLYEVATGREPFNGVPADGLQAAAKLIPPSVPCPEIEPALERAILQCLEEDPSRRPESAEAVAALLPA